MKVWAFGRIIWKIQQSLVFLACSHLHFKPIYRERERARAFNRIKDLKNTYFADRNDFIRERRRKSESCSMLTSLAQARPAFVIWPEPSKTVDKYQHSTAQQNYSNRHIFTIDKVVCLHIFRIPLKWASYFLFVFCVCAWLVADIPWLQHKKSPHPCKNSLLVLADVGS